MGDTPLTKERSQPRLEASPKRLAKRPAAEATLLATSKLKEAVHPLTVLSTEADSKVNLLEGKMAVQPMPQIEGQGKTTTLLTEAEKKVFRQGKPTLK